MKVVERKIADLIAAEYNPRRLTGKQHKTITESMKRFGVVDPVIVNMHTGREGVIVGGHQRVKIWGELGNEFIPTVEVCLDVAQEKELNVRLNNNSGEWDWETLVDNFAVDDLCNWGFENVDFGCSFDDYFGSDGESENEELKHNESLKDFSVGRFASHNESGEIFTNGKIVNIYGDYRAKLPFDFPSMLKEKCPTINESDVGVWCGADKSNSHEYYLYNYGTDSVKGLNFQKTILAFYTDDFRWDPAIWGKRTSDTLCRIINAQIPYVVAPDYSAYWEWQQALRLYNVYRQRATARIMQECGINVIPSLQVCPKDMEWCLNGIPEGCGTIALQWHVRSGNEKEFNKLKRECVRKAIDIIKPKNVLLYAGIKGKIEYDKIPDHPETIYINTRERVRGRKISKAKEEVS